MEENIFDAPEHKNIRTQEHKNNLNPEQQRAVEHRDGPVLILAGAGSGKTRVLTQRIAHLVQQHQVSPQSILAVTFTNKAAHEMRDRVERLVGSVQGMWVTTFHSAGLRLLRQEAPLLGLPRDFVIYDDADQSKILRDILRTLNLDEKRNPVNSLIGQIGRAKDQLLSAADVEKVAEGTYGAVMAKVFAAYEAELKKARAVDFADLISLPVRLFREFPAVLQRYQSRFRYIMIDEYQDTNHAQYQLIRSLTQGHDNLCVVGDPDQSIYAWRGADIRNILTFEEDFPNAAIIRLEQNYRSTQMILNASNAVIANNRARKPKALWTDNNPGDPIALHAHPTDLDEAGWAARNIYRMVREGRRYRDVAIFYRTNAQSRVYEEAFRRAGIPYMLLGGVRFYERREVKDLLAYLRLIVNPHDGVSLTRIMNVPTRGIGKTTEDRLVDAAAQAGCSVYEFLTRPEAHQAFQASTQKKLQTLVDLCAALQDLQTQPLEVIWERLLELTGYLGWLTDAHGDDEAAERVANIEELGRALAEFPVDPTLEGTPLQQFLDQVALVSDLDSLDAEAGMVRLMTLHLAKGLEFPIVFMVGMEEGLFPHSRSLNDDDGIEEERRLCYVGMTRAQERLFMSYADRRRLHGRDQYNVPSRFLDEIPKEMLQPDIKMMRRECATPGNVFSPQPAFGKVAAFESDDDYSQLPPDEQEERLRLGSRVAHPMFGPGTVLNVEGTGEKQKVTVRFNNMVVKTLLVSMARLNILSSS